MSKEAAPNTAHNETREWSVATWTDEIQKADTEGKLAFFNDVITGKNAPSKENDEHLVLKDVLLGGKTCDIYHWDQKDGSPMKGATSCRVYVHIKD